MQEDTTQYKIYVYTFRLRINNLKVMNSHRVFVSFNKFSVCLHTGYPPWCARQLWLLACVKACGVLGVILNKCLDFVFELLLQV